MSGQINILGKTNILPKKYLVPNKYLGPNKLASLKFRAASVAETAAKSEDTFVLNRSYIQEALWLFAEGNLP